MNKPTEIANRVAIVGRAGRFPSARSVDQFWSMVAGERTGTTWLRDEDLLAAGVSRAELADPNYVKAAQILPDMECFDAGFWGFSPREASILDPQHRHFLETAWEALEDAGHMPEDFDGRVGVFAGSGMQAYLPFNLLSNPDLVREIGLFLLRHTGNDKDFLTTRLSYLLNLHGPSVAVQTACSTSLVAVHMAAQSLLNLECDMAIAGGVTIELPHRRGYHYAAGEILSPDGICRAFDNDSQGTVFGSGSAILVLRRLEDALADGDDIKATILASAVNNDGAQKAGYLAPSVDGQAECAAEALALAGVDAGTVGYIEAHGTGTPVGDPIELAALSQAYGAGGAQFCGIGSVKTNIGHLDTAAGAASLIKVVEALRHKTLPASLNYKTPNARFDIAGSPFYVVDSTRPWQTGGTPRRAAVNSLGVGGTNAHVIVEEAPERAPAPRGDDWRLYPFSARTRASLDGANEKWSAFLGGGDVPAPSDITYTLRHGRRAFDERMAVAARGPKDLKAAMAGDAPELLRRGNAGDGEAEVVFLFPGGGAQYPGAGRDLLEESEVFRSAVAECFEVLPDEAPEDLFDVMFESKLEDREARRKLNASAYAIPALFILEYAYSRLWESWGIRPAAILAHSVGEYAGAVVAGAMSVKDAMRVVTLRGQVMDAAPPGAMTVVPASAEVVRQLVGDSLDIAAVNAPQISVVSGTVAEIEALEARLKDTEHEARRIHIDVAAHSRVLDGQLGAFRRGFEGVTFSQPTVPFVSSLRGDWGREGDFSSAEYWVQHLRNTVQFTGAVAKVLDKPNRIILEVGPGQTLGPLVDMAEAPQKARAIIASARKPSETVNDMGAAVAALGAIWANGGAVDWSLAPGGDDGRRVSLPTYAFEKVRHWVEPGRGIGSAEAADQTATESVALERIEAIDDWFAGFEWAELSLPPATARPEGGLLLVGAEGALAEAAAAAFAGAGIAVTRAGFGDAFAATDDGYTLRAGDEADAEALLEALGTLPSRILLVVAADADRAHAFDTGFALMRGLQLADAGAGIEVAVAVGGTVALEGEEVTGIEAAALLGPVRIAPREMPGLRAALIDVGTAMEPEAAATALVEEFGAGLPADRVLLRPGRRLVERRVGRPTEAPAEKPSRLRHGGSYLVTGGLGGIGRALALYLAEAVQARIAIVSRSARPDAALEAAIRGHGGEVMFIAADVTDRAAMEAAICKVRQGFGGLNGVFHAAGTIDDAPLAMKTRDAAHAVIAPKLDGGRILADLIPDGSVEVFAVFSSSSVVIAPAGQVDYVAANAGLEALAASRSDGLSIAWGVWKDIGMARRAYGADSTAGSHPLLGARSDGAGGAIRFEGTIDPALWVVAEHVVAGQPVLPGTGYLEIIRAAMAEAAPGRAWEIEALAFDYPMIFVDGLPLAVAVVLTPAADGYDLQVETAAGDGPLEHVHARIRLGGKADTAVPPALRPRAAKGLTRSARSGHAPQEALIAFGPRWHCIGEIRTGERLAEGDFALASDFAGDLGDYHVHPALMDMAMTVGLNLLADGGAEGKVYAPMSIGRVRLLAPLPAELTSRARLKSEQPGRMATFDVLIADKAGRPVAVLEGLAMRAVEGGALGGPAPDASAAPLTDRLLASGIRAAEAPALFARMLDLPAGSRVTVSPVSLEVVRAAMAEAFRPRQATGDEDEAAASDDPVEAQLATIWRDLLGVGTVRPEDDFFALGGHSLNAVRMFGRIRKEFGVDLPLATLFEAPKMAALATRIAEVGGLSRTARSNGDATAAPAVVAAPWTPLVEIKKGAEGTLPLYCVHGAGGNVLNFRQLSGHLAESVPFYGLRALGSDGGAETDATVEDMAQRYLDAVLARQPEGPYRLAGYSGGGVIAYEMAQRLVAAGHEVSQIYFFDTLVPEAASRRMNILQKLWAARHWDLKFALGWRERRRAVAEARRKSAAIKALLEAGQPLPDELNGVRMTSAYLTAQGRYRPKPYAGPVTIFRATWASVQFIAAGELLGWEPYLKGPVAVHSFECDHFSMMSDPAISEIGDILNADLQGKD